MNGFSKFFYGVAIIWICKKSCNLSNCDFWLLVVYYAKKPLQ